MRNVLIELVEHVSTTPGAFLRPGIANDIIEMIATNIFRPLNNTTSRLEARPHDTFMEGMPLTRQASHQASLALMVVLPLERAAIARVLAARLMKATTARRRRSARSRQTDMFVRTMER